jgi:hypothetical protein
MSGRRNGLLSRAELGHLVEYEKMLGTSLRIPMTGMRLLGQDSIAKMEREPYLALIEVHGSAIFI